MSWVCHLAFHQWITAMATGNQDVREVEKPNWKQVEAKVHAKGLTAQVLNLWQGQSSSTAGLGSSGYSRKASIQKAVQSRRGNYLHAYHTKKCTNKMYAWLQRSQGSPRSRPWRVIAISQEGDRTTDTEDIVMRTPEFKDKNFHFQKFLGRKTRVWVMGQGSPN